MSSICKTFNNFETCIECYDNYYLSSGKCCPLGTANNGSDICVTDDSTIHCTEWTFVSVDNHTCSKC